MFKNKLHPFLSAAIIYSCLFAAVFLVSCNGQKSSKAVDSTASVIGIGDTFPANGAVIAQPMLKEAVINKPFVTASAVSLVNQHDIVISGKAYPQILLYNCYNITIRNCKIGPNKRFGIRLVKCNNIVIDSCYIYNVSTGVLAINSRTISVTNCQAKNMMGPYPQGQFVQYKNISGPGNVVSFNKFENLLGESSPEDAISMYKSNGTATSPILIESNWIRGGGPSKSGGGIMLGDGGGSNILARNNFLVDPGQYGMAVAGGTNMGIVNNTIYARSQPFTNVGLYYWNQSKLPSSNITIAKNAVNYIKSNNKVNNTYLANGEETPKGWQTNVYNAGLNAGIIPDSIISDKIFSLQSDAK